MDYPLLLASASSTRISLLQRAGLVVDAVPARLDEESLRAAMSAEGVVPRDMADHLAEAKAAKLAGRYPDRLVLGCDQVLEHAGDVLGKASNQADLRLQLERLRGDTHTLWSAAVLYGDARPVWRHIGEARMTMVDFSDNYLDGYMVRNADQLAHTVGGYMLEGEGIRLFTQIKGDYFTVLGLPLLPLLRQLTRMDVLDG